MALRSTPGRAPLAPLAPLAPPADARWLRPEAAALIDARHGPLAPPVRSVLFGSERFRQHGHSLAAAQPIERRRHWPRRIRTPHFFPRIAANLRSIERARDYLEALDRQGETLDPAAEWLLDNFHLIEAQVPEVRNDLPHGYYDALPKLRGAPLTGLPRVYGIAWAFVTHTDSNFDAGLLADFLRAYQEVDALTLGELWAIPATLRVVLLENLARLAESVAGRHAAQEAANNAFDRDGELDRSQLDAVYRKLKARGLHAAFLAQLALRLRSAGDGAAAAAPLAVWLEARSADAAPAPTSGHESQAADNVSVSNAVTALHAIDNLDWKALVEQVSLVLALLNRSPAFVAESDLSRDQCTHSVELLAHRLRKSELEVARAAFDLDAQADRDPPAGPSHWLIGRGRSDLIRHLGGSPARVEGGGWRLLRRARGPLVATALIGGTLAVLALLFPDAAWLSSPAMLALPFAALAAFEVVFTLVTRVLAELVPVRRLPRLALDEGLQAEHRTLVVVPCLLTSSAGVQELARRIERHYLANPEAHTRFALLSDWADAPGPHAQADTEQLEAARAAIDELNLRHPTEPGQLPRFALLHRERVWCEGEGVWMGWERKRGKLQQLLSALAGEGPRTTPFVELGTLSALDPDVRFVVTLDTETEMPAGTLRDLVAIAAHPLNEPRLDPQTRRVVEGFGILQPRIACPLPNDEDVNLHGWLMSGPWGFDVYNNGSSELYQDVFGQGTFSGKGLLNVHAMQQAMHGRIPENRVLSHDLYEGVWARSAHLSDVSLVEPVPMHPDVRASQLHRWTRGDWQLLPFLAAALRGRVGMLNVWKMLDNLRRTLLTPACLTLLWLALALDALPPAWALALVAASLGLGPLLGALVGLVPWRRDLALRHFLGEGLRELLRALGGTLWQLLTLPLAAAVHTDAMVRALWRMLISRRRLLQWTTAAQAQAASRLELPVFLRRHLGLSLLALGFTGSALLVAAPHLGWLAAIGTVWALAPLWLWAGSQPIRRPDGAARLASTDIDYLQDLARDTWSLFERIVGPDDHDLPPDNLQLEPDPMLARRTSPTNIGLYLASCACAQRLGLIGTRELVDRLGRTLDTLESLPRLRGHFYNWISTADLTMLAPRYVSTVDSGNLVALAWTVAQRCRELAAGADASAPDAVEARALLDRAARLDTIVRETDFRFLYDRKRRLFHIGYRVEDGALDRARYDLLASESRLGSYVAIAKGDVPVTHWQALGRPFLAVDGKPTLRSWSGSMFEYLMPTLLMHEPRGSLLQRVAVTALRAQRRFGADKGVPWGVSECAYYEQDHTYAFQYGPFGVPMLALRRTPLEDRVIAPYASALALQVDAPAALANLRTLEALGARGEHGFIESLDFSAPRRGESAPMQRVHTFMAHHQGMTLLSLCNLLCDDGPRGWFERVPRVTAHATLLHERMARCVVLQSRAIPRPPHRDDAGPGLGAPRTLDPTQLAPGAGPSLLLGNGAYSVCLRANGAGQSRWRGRALTRERDDLLRDAQGQWLLLTPGAGQPTCSLTLAPLGGDDIRRETRFYADHAEFDADGPGWSAQLKVWVSADDDVELRELTLRNRRDQAVEVTLTSLFEAALAPQAADEAHPAFSNLFVQAQADGDDCLLLERRPHREGDAPVWVAHFLATDDVQDMQAQVTADRSQLMPRRGTPAQWQAPAAGGSGPVADVNGRRVGTGLDPVGSVTVRLQLPAKGRRRLTFGTAAAFDASNLRSIVDEYRAPTHLRRSALMSATLARIRQRELHHGPAELRAVQDLTTPMTMSRARPRRAPAVAIDRRTLWRFGLSGERPLALVRVDSTQGLRAVRTLLGAHRLWDELGLHGDLVILNGEPASYLMPLQHRIVELRESLGLRGDPEPGRGAVHLLRLTEVSAQELAALRAHARIDLVADGRPMERLLGGATPTLTPAAAPPTPAPAPPQAPAPWPDTAVRHGFTEGGRWFRFQVDQGHLPARPWSNVLANEHFGSVVTEGGGGYTWAGNSRLNQLTPWSNDPLLDPAGEHFEIEDPVDGVRFGLMPSVDRNGDAGYRVSHGAGISRFEQQRGTLAIDTRVMVDPVEAAKLVVVRVRHDGGQPIRLRLLAMVEWILGAQRRDRMTLQTEYASTVQAVLARQLEHNSGFGDGTALLLLAGARVEGWSCSRAGFFDHQGTMTWPARLDGRHGFGLDPCGALAAELELAPGASASWTWVIGHAPGREAALALARRLHAPGMLDGVEARVRGHWDALLSAVTVATPDPLFDALTNRWLLLQTVVCRLWARAGFYQAGGATGFRDQLQDTLALAWSRPGMLRKQILRHASRQFVEGDVQHWWHMPTGAGVRTRFSDDLLWLPYAIRHLIDVGGDRTVLDEQVPFLEGGAIPDQAEDLYEMASDSGQDADLYEHGARAIDHALRFGSHGLPLMGGGDWNDGMNHVGREGRGESVWLGWFLATVLRGWLPLARWRRDHGRLDRWRQAARGLHHALATQAWDGAWFRRAYFDNGNPLGSSRNEECRIDLIAQAWSVGVLPAGDPRARQAMASADRLLVDREHGLIRLLDPPLQHAKDHAGYIQSYPPGVRENGGQYTHAAVWGLMAQAALGDGERAWQYFRMISPAHRVAGSDQAQRRYGIEPYVLPGDTYSAAPYAGRGGWSWYSGSAAWLYRAALESIVGLRLRRRGTRLHLCLRPCLPAAWPWVELSLKLDGRELHLRLQRAGSAAGTAVWAAQARTLAPGQWVRLEEDKAPAWFLLPLPAAELPPAAPSAAGPTAAEKRPSQPVG